MAGQSSNSKRTPEMFRLENQFRSQGKHSCNELTSEHCCSLIFYDLAVVPKGHFTTCAVKWRAGKMGDLNTLSDFASVCSVIFNGFQV